MPLGLRHKCVNGSIGSLTATDTRDCFEDVRSDDDESETSSAIEADFFSDSELETSSPRLRVKRRGSRTCDLSPHGLTARDLATVAEAEDDVDAALSDVPTDKLTRSTVSECDMDEVDELMFSEPVLHEPLLNIEEGILPPSVAMRFPPIAWLRAAGFDVPNSKGFDAAPVAPVCGEKPSRYMDLFSRQMIERERTSDLTVGSVSNHEASAGRSRHITSLPKAIAQPAHPPAEILSQNGAWLEAFIAKARSVPMHRAVDEVVGADLGCGVAAFLDTLSDTSEAAASIADEDVPDGLHVTGQKIRVRHVHQGHGRAGFLVDCEATVQTPGRSQSPVSRRQPPPLSLDPPRPPLINGPLQPFSERRRRGYALPLA